MMSSIRRSPETDASWTFSPNSVHFAHSETAVFQSLLSNLRPACSIEVGTETGTTLALIARHSTRAISIDIDPGVKSAPAGQVRQR
jgi:cephalosporin hydroxylase